MITLAAVSAGHASALYTQAPDLDALGAGYFSDGAPGQFYSQRTADDFLAPAAAEITGIDWFGLAESAAGSDLQNVTAFDVAVYASAAEAPGALLWSAQFATAATLPAEVGVTPGLVSVYQHSVVVAPPLPVTAGTRYWLSIGAVAADPQGDAYAWHFATDAYNTVAAFDYFDGLGWESFSGQHDLAFTIVPEPTSFLAVLLAAAACRRR
jgi:hypothetical protein